MKRFICIVVLAISAITISSYADSHQPQPSNFQYFTRIKAVDEDGRYTALYLYFEEFVDGKRYYSSCGDTESQVCYLFVELNRLYQSTTCNDFRRNYKYRTYYTGYYFNFDKDLPDFINYKRK